MSRVPNDAGTLVVHGGARARSGVMHCAALGVLGLVCAACDAGRDTLATGAATSLSVSPEELVMQPAMACGATRATSQRRAAAAEAQSDARWDRFPFADEEAAASIRSMREALQCYTVALDGEGRLRAEVKLHERVHVLMRFVDKARLVYFRAREDGARDLALLEARRLLRLLEPGNKATQLFRGALDLWVRTESVQAQSKGLEGL